MTISLHSPSLPYIRVALLVAVFTCAGIYASESDELIRDFASSADNWYKVLFRVGFRLCGIISALFTLAAMIFTEHRGKILTSAVIFFITASALKKAVMNMAGDSPS